MVFLSVGRHPMNDLSRWGAAAWGKIKLSTRFLHIHRVSRHLVITTGGFVKKDNFNLGYGWRVLRVCIQKVSLLFGEEMFN